MCLKCIKIGRPLSNMVRKHILFCIFMVILIVSVGFIFYPRHVKTLLNIGDKTTVVEIIKVADEETDAQKIILNLKEQKALMKIFKNSYVRLKIFHKNYVNSNNMGYLLFLSNNRDTIHFLSSDIISINGTQYKVYGRTLSTEFKTIIEREE